MRPHRRQPTRLLHAWDFPGKSTGVGCHCLLQNVMIEHLKLINIYRTVYLKVANKQNMHYFQAHMEHSLRYCTSVQFSSAAQSCPTLCNLWTAACQVSLSFTTSKSLLQLISIESVKPSSISSSVIPFSSCHQSFPASGSF